MFMLESPPRIKLYLFIDTYSENSPRKAMKLSQFADGGLYKTDITLLARFKHSTS